ncbi:metal-sensing transcriptional repressor [Buttiauxella noackiae]|uniref:metal-sensing transcriptional repressor n=1 Tax=Buttiauxella noackiae TaxID=82992 RepID=UPI003B5C1D19
MKKLILAATACLTFPALATVANPEALRINATCNAYANTSRMLDEPHECAAVLQQICAIRRAVNGLMREVIKGHLIDHIVREDSEAKREND